MKPFRHGLVVGKFSPLHLGHEQLLRHALDACERVTAISYSKPEFARCDRAAREQWLAARLPQVERLVLDDTTLAVHCRQRGRLPPDIPANDAPDEDHRAFVGWLCSELLAANPDAVFTSEAYGDGFAADLSRHLGGPVRHVSFDPERTAVHVSGSAVRADPHRNRAFLADEVYAAFVRRVCVLGGESSGKSSLAQALADALGSSWAPEYGRELWQARGGHLEYADMLAIARTQVMREHAAACRARGWLVCDTSPLTTLFYSRALFGRSDPALELLAGRAYDCTVLCAPDFDFVQDGTRRDAAFRREQHQWYVDELARRSVACVIAHGALTARVRTVLDALPR